jgi:phosphatidylglycerophosphate synthase
MFIQNHEKGLKMTNFKSVIKTIYTERNDEDFIKKSESISVMYIGRLFGIPLARAIKKIPINIHPNIVTVFSFFFAIAAAYCFFQNLLIIGAVFYLINFVLDCTDGTLARLTNTTSKIGAKLDFYTDRIGIVGMYFGLWWSQYYQDNNYFLGAIIIISHYAITFLGDKSVKNQKYKTIFPRVNSYYSSFEEGIGTFFVAPLLGIVTVLFPILVFLQLISYFILYFKNRRSAKMRMKK